MVNLKLKDGSEDIEPRILLRPDGYYWLAADNGREGGPFATADDAMADARAGDETEIEPDKALGEAEDSLGVANWIDPETGDPGEEQRPRTEEH